MLQKSLSIGSACSANFRFKETSSLINLNCWLSKDFLDIIFFSFRSFKNLDIFSRLSTLCGSLELSLTSCLPSALSPVIPMISSAFSSWKALSSSMDISPDSTVLSSGELVSIPPINKKFFDYIFTRNNLLPLKA